MNDHKKNKTIGVTMIVKNESAILKRCLESVLNCIPKLDGVVICDTGSTDNTIEVAQKFGVDKDIPVYIYKHKWKNFGHNRTLSLNVARDKFDWMFLIDADMELKLSNSSKKFYVSELEDNIEFYLIEQKQESTAYYNVRIIRSDFDCFCFQPTHEYFRPRKGEAKTKRLDSLWFDDHEDGGAKEDKFKRDIRLLDNFLKEYKGDPIHLLRTHFYLAQSYCAIDQFEKAMVHYAIRAESESNVDIHPEEKYMARVQYAHCLRQLDRYDEALLAFLKAYNLRPFRNSAICMLVQMLISSEYTWHGSAFDLAFRAYLNNYPEKDNLFVNRQFHSWYPFMLLSFSGAELHKMSSQFNVGYLATEKLLLNTCDFDKRNNDKVPLKVRCLAVNTLGNYCKSIFQLFPQNHVHGRFIHKSQYGHEVLQKGGRQWYPCNPSIIKSRVSKDKLIMNLRLVDYKYDPNNGQYQHYSSQEKKYYSSSQLNDPSYKGQISTRNLIFQFDKKCLENKEFTLNLEEGVETYCQDTKPLDNTQTPYVGFEDIRLYKNMNNEYRFTATAPPYTPNGEIQTVHGSVNVGSGEVSNVKHCHLGDGFKGPSKNWGHIQLQGKDRFVYSLDPLIIISVDENTGLSTVQDEKKVKISSSTQLNIDLLGARGGSQYIPWENGFLSVFHFICTKHTKPHTRVYWHRFVYIGKVSQRVEMVSEPFYFLTTGVEFCCSLTNLDGKICLAYGRNDYLANYVTIMSYDLLKNMREHTKNVLSPLTLNKKK